MKRESSFRDNDLGPARPLAVLAGHQHYNDADRLTAPVGFGSLGQRTAVLGRHLLADRIAIGSGGGRRQYGAGAKHQHRCPDHVSELFHTQRSNPPWLNAK